MVEWGIGRRGRTPGGTQGHHCSSMTTQDLAVPVDGGDSRGSTSHIARAPDTVRAGLRILEITDLHANLLAYDYFADRPAQGTGLALAAALVGQLRAEADTCLVFDNGDFLQGNPMADGIAGDAGFGPGDLHPVIAAMNTLAFDAGTLGNHEFDYGLEFLTDAIAAASFPLVSANTFRQSDLGPQPIVPPWIILNRQVMCDDGQRRTLRVGVIGFAPPTLVNWNRIVLQQRVTTCDILVAARAGLVQMQAAGVDLVVALSHSGIEAGVATPDMENASVPLAALPGIDVILTGHTHQVFPGPDVAAADAIDPVQGSLHGKPTVMAGSNGRHVGVIDLTLVWQDGRWSVDGFVTRVAPVCPGASPPMHGPDAGVLAAAQASHDAILAHIRQPLGQTAVALHSYFALVAPDRTLDIVATALAGHAARMVQDSPWANLPILAAVAPTKAGGLGGAGNFIDIPPGPLVLHHAAELCVFPNSLCVLEIDAKGVRDWLDHAAGIYCRISPGQQGQPLIDPGRPSYNYDVIFGVTYLIDPSQPCRTDAAGRIVAAGASRIRDLRWNGQDIAPDQRFLIATNSYRVGGGGGFAMTEGARIIHHSAENTRDIVAAYLRRTRAVAPLPRPVWRFCGLPDTTAVFDSGPGAMQHLADAGAAIRPDGPGAAGMQRFVVSFPD